VKVRLLAVAGIASVCVAPRALQHPEPAPLIKPESVPFVAPPHYAKASRIHVISGPPAPTGLGEQVEIVDGDRLDRIDAQLRLIETKTKRRRALAPAAPRAVESGPEKARHP
jgi:hypothetical protein